MKTTISCLVTMFAVACVRSNPAPQPIAPNPAPALTEAAPTIEEARAFRTAGQLDRYEHALQLLTNSTDVKTRGRAEALLALFYLDQNRAGEGRPLLDRAATDDPPIAPWMWLRIGDQRSLGRILQQAPASSAAVTAR